MLLVLTLVTLPPNFEPMGDRVIPNACHPVSPQSMGPAANIAVRGFWSQVLSIPGDLATALNQVRVSSVYFDEQLLLD